MKLIISFILFSISFTIKAQPVVYDIRQSWQFKKSIDVKWFPASVPGTIHTDLFNTGLIPDPFYRDNEIDLKWIDTVNWDYQTHFHADEIMVKKKNIELVFDGLDTYVDVYLNNRLILKANNMFRQWIVPVKSEIRSGVNHLKLKFYAAKKVADSLAWQQLPLVLPDHNRVYARKAQFQFGWDWGPVFIGAGIWKKVWIDAYDDVSASAMMRMEKDQMFQTRKKDTRLIQMPDSSGVSFFFEKNGKPVYAKGANWIPANIFLPEVKRSDYRKLLLMVKEANMNMLRVWGGGIYEADEFYDICDELGIMVWQDFMFAGGMYPGTDSFLKNVKEEVRYQVSRLRHHPCIVLWCGNNEIDEAWNNWGWQKQFNLHGTDSAKVWTDYLTLFRDSLPVWLNEFDGTRPYIASSPMHGWGREESYKKGDSHYWGIWWGLQDWETFYTKTGRFVSEYGMQAMPDKRSINRFTAPVDRSVTSKVIQSHQKANNGFNKLNHYLKRYFIDSANLEKLSLDEYNYLTQCLQYYMLKNSIAIHRSKQPYNMGTLLWQLNDCWPVTSWSIIDHYKYPKAGWYAVKQAYRDDIIQKTDSIYPKHLVLEKPVFTIQPASDSSFTISANKDAKYVFIEINASDGRLSDNYFDLKAGEKKEVIWYGDKKQKMRINTSAIRSLYDIIHHK